MTIRYDDLPKAASLGHDLATRRRELERMGDPYQIGTTCRVFGIPVIITDGIVEAAAASIKAEIAQMETDLAALGVEL